MVKKTGDAARSDYSEEAIKLVVDGKAELFVELENRVLDAEVARRLSDGGGKTYSDASVRGAAAKAAAVLDENDGWE